MARPEVCEHCLHALPCLRSPAMADYGFVHCQQEQPPLRHALFLYRRAACRYEPPRFLPRPEPI